MREVGGHFSENDGSGSAATVASGGIRKVKAFLQFVQSNTASNNMPKENKSGKSNPSTKAKAVAKPYVPKSPLIPYVTSYATLQKFINPPCVANLAGDWEFGIRKSDRIRRYQARQTMEKWLLRNPYVPSYQV